MNYMNYDEIYSKSKNVWGEKPNELLQLVVNDIPARSEILDLGSAQGKDALYLASLGFIVTAVDKSRTGHDQLEFIIKENKIQNIVAICEDISNFEIKKEKYFIINTQNTLHFLEKEKSLRIIEDIKNKLPKNGFAVISLFTTEDPSFLNESTSILSHLEKQELLRLFLDFEIVFYLETKFIDKGHAGQEEPHQHGVAKIIARKVDVVKKEFEY